MNSNKLKLLDVLAFPKRSFENLTDNKKTLFAGIVLIGAVDLLLPDVVYFFKTVFSGKQSGDIIYNAVLSAIIILLLGFIDVFFISIPLFDVFRALKTKELKVIQSTGMDKDLPEDFKRALDFKPLSDLKPSEGLESSPEPKPSYIKVMKIYIMAHFIVKPIEVAFNYAVSGYAADSPEWLVNLAMIFIMLMTIWFSAIIARGINAIFRFSLLFNRLTFIIVYIWYFVFGNVLNGMIVKWLMELLR